MLLNIVQLLGIIGFLLCLCEYIAARHREICMKSDTKMISHMKVKFNTATFDDAREAGTAINLYWNRGAQ